MNPAIGVHDSSRDAINDTINWIANVLTGSDQEGGTGKDHDRGLVMESEDIVVYAILIELQKFLKLSKDVKHGGDLLLLAFLRKYNV